MSDATPILTAAQLRRHAQVMRSSVAPRGREDMRDAMAGRLEAEADMLDAEAGQYSGISDSAIISRVYPILGRVDTEGGALVKVERPWGEEQIAAAEARGIYVSWEWSLGYSSGLDQGKLHRIYIGTQWQGPVACWYNGRWRKLTSKGNYGRNYSHGGTWSASKESYPSLGMVCPEIQAHLAAREV